MSRIECLVIAQLILSRLRHSRTGSGDFETPRCFPSYPGTVLLPFQSKSASGTGTMTPVWSTIRVFISSTFRDMHAERDHLVKVVFPALRERLEPFQFHLVDIDLRWGITAEQAERDQVLDLCLDYIDECRPFFLGILGDRYGWVPGSLPEETSRHGWTQRHSGRSVTDLEIQWGVLLNAEMRSQSLFFFRDPKFLADVPTDLQHVFVAENDAAALKQAELKQTIRTADIPTEPATYPCRFAGVRISWDIARLELNEVDRQELETLARDGLIDPSEYKRLTPALREKVNRLGLPYLGGLEEFGRQVLETLWSAIQRQYGLADRPKIPAVDPMAADGAAHERFIESRLRVYVGRRGLYDQLTEYTLSNTRVPCMVSGRSGSGKSAAMAKFVRDFTREHADVFVLPHFIGASPESTNLRQMLFRLCTLLSRHFGFAEELPPDLASLTTAWRNLLDRIPADRRTVIVLDAVDQLDEVDLARGLHWLPTTLPEHVKLIFSVIEMPDRLHPVQEMLAERDLLRLAVDPLSNDERIDIVRTVPSISAKTLDASQIQRLLENPETTNPLYLLVALEELRGFGSFEQLNHRIALFPRGEDAVTALFHQVIERLEREFRRSTVQTALMSLAAARRGLSDRELLDLVEDPGVPLSDSKSDLFAVLRQLRPYLQRRGLLIGFFHRNLDRAVRAHYFTSAEIEATAHQRLADYFHQQDFFLESLEEQRRRVETLPPTPRAVNLRKVDELPWQLLRVAKLSPLNGPHWDAVTKLLTDWTFLEAKVEARL